MRNGIFTYYKGFHLEINTIRDDDERILLNYKGEYCPFDEFVKSNHEQNTYNLIINLKDLKNAYYVKTYGEYNGLIFQIFDLKYSSENIIRIGTNERDKFNTATGLQENNKEWYIYDINASNLKRLWEVRKPYFDLPMPAKLEEIENIEIPN